MINGNNIGRQGEWIVVEYKVTSSETVHVGRFDIVCEKVFQDGKEYPFSYVRIKDCAAAICMIDDDVILLKEYRYTIDSWEWEIPAGSVEKGDDPTETIVREIQEETGFSIDEIKFLGWYHLSVGSTTERVFIYYAKCNQPSKQQLEALEKIEVHRIPKADFEKMVKSNEIHQCMGVTAWERYKTEIEKVSYV